MPSDKRFGIWGVLALWLLAVFLGCDSRPQPPLRVGILPWAGYEPIWLARELGYFDKHPVQVLEFSSGTQGLRAFRNGAIEAATLTMDEAIALAQDSSDLKVVLVIDFSNGADVMLGQPQITSLQDLRGKRVGYEASAEGAYLLSRALEHGGLQPSDINTVSLEFDEHEKSFREGSVDAIVTFEPARSRLVAMGAKLLFDSSKIPGEIIDVLVVKESYLKQHPNTVDAFLEGWFKVVKYMKEKPEDASKRLSVRLKMTPAEVLDVYSRIKLLELPENRQLVTASPPGLLAPSQRLADIMFSQKLLSSPFQVRPLIEPAPISRIKPE